MAAFDVASVLGIPLWLFYIVVIWSLVWKGLALWKSARKSSKIWFIVLLIVNTMGILEILYIFLFSKLNLKPTKQTVRKPRIRTTRMPTLTTRKAKKKVKKRK